MSLPLVGAVIVAVLKVTYVTCAGHGRCWLLALQPEGDCRAAGCARACPAPLRLARLPRPQPQGAPWQAASHSRLVVCSCLAAGRICISLTSKNIERLSCGSWYFGHTLL